MMYSRRSPITVAVTTVALLLLSALTLSVNAAAEEKPLGDGWRLDTDSSRLTFQSVKNNSIVEAHGFAIYDGVIAPDGKAEIRVQLNSVDTGIDLRNVRMRFLFFESFKFPEAVVTTRIDPAALADLATQRRMRMPLEYELDLHGVKQTLQAEVVVTLIADDRVSVATASPITLALEPFGLLDGMKKLEDAAKVQIVPAGSVTFDFVFRPIQRRNENLKLVSAPAAATALETRGVMSREECAGRFEILSRTGSIYFKTGSAQIDAGSEPLLETVLDIAKRCPALDIVVEGHTDSVGSDVTNQILSEARARSVAMYLSERGVGPQRLRAVGYGAARPIAPNDTPGNQARNRRIEFAVASD